MAPRAVSDASCSASVDSGFECPRICSDLVEGPSRVHQKDTRCACHRAGSRHKYQRHPLCSCLSAPAGHEGGRVGPHGELTVTVVAELWHTPGAPVQIAMPSQCPATFKSLRGPFRSPAVKSLETPNSRKRRVCRGYLPLRLSVRVKPKWRLCQRENALSAENPSRSATSVRRPLLPSR